MPDRDLETGSSSTFKQRYVELAANVYARGVALLSLISGEDQVNNRMRVENRPADEDSILETLQNAATATGTGTAINVKGFNGVSIAISATSGTWSGGFQATINDSTWFNVAVIKGSDNAVLVAGTAGTTVGTQVNISATTHDELYTFPSIPRAWSQVRFNIGARSSGAITVTSRKTPR